MRHAFVKSHLIFTFLDTPHQPAKYLLKLIRRINSIPSSQDRTFLAVLIARTSLAISASPFNGAVISVILK